MAEVLVRQNEVIARMMRRDIDHALAGSYELCHPVNDAEAHGEDHESSQALG